jgi:hypothetical protein
VLHGVFHDLIVLAAAEQNADAWVFVRALAVPVERLQIKGQLAHVLGFKAAGLQFKRHQALQVAVIEEQIEFEILVAHLHTHLFADKGKAVAKLHQEFAQITQQRSLLIGLAEPLRQVEEVEEVTVFEDTGCVLRQNSQRWCEFLIGQHYTLECRVPDLASKLTV